MVVYMPVNLTPARFTDLTVIVTGDDVEVVVVVDVVVVLELVALVEVVDMVVLAEEVVELDVCELVAASVATVWENRELSVEYGFAPLRLSMYMYPTRGAAPVTKAASYETPKAMSPKFDSGYPAYVMKASDG
jgi:hypothetical protein